jgi:hypothetical protein
MLVMMFAMAVHVLAMHRGAVMMAMAVPHSHAHAGLRIPMVAVVPVMTMTVVVMVVAMPVTHFDLCGISAMPLLNARIV